MIYISNQLKTITLTRRGSFVPSGDTYSLLLTNNYSQLNCIIELEDTSENPKKFVFELTDEQFESLDYGEYNFVLMNGSDKVYAGMLRVMQEFQPDVVYQWTHGDQPEPEPVYYDVYIAAGENGHLLIDGETYTVYTDTVLKGTRLTVEAVADNGYQINSWSDGSTADTRSFVVNSNVTLLVAFEAVPVVTYHRVELYADPHGSIIVNGTEYIEDYIATLEEGTTLTVEASPFEGYQFDGWSDGSSVNPRTIVVNSDITISAAFEAVPVVNYFQVNISAGNNGSVSVNGVVGNYNEQVEEGTVLTVVATPDQDYQFQGWSDGDLNQTRTITVTSNVTISAAFEAIPSTMYWVNINSGANGQVSVNGVVGNYSQQVPENTILSVEAIPATGYEFVSWNDGNTHAQRNITVTGDVQLQSSYQIMSFTVSIASDDTNEGTVTVNGTTGDYSSTMTYGSMLSFSATPATGYVFVEWSDGDTNASRITSVTSSITLAALFAVQTFNVSISGDAHTAVTVNGTPAPYTGTVNYGTQLSLVATPDTGYDFQGWSDGDVNTTRSITVTADTTLSCTSAIQTFSVSISSGNNGSVSVNGVSGNYNQTVNYGTVLTVEAVPNATYDFVSWSDGNSTNPRTITVTSNLTLTCSFEENIQVLPNQLKYRTQSGDPVVPNGNFYDDNSNGLQILSNTYTDGIGVIELDGNAYYMDNEMFNNNTDLTEVYFPPYLSVSDLGLGNCTNLVKFETEDTANSPFRYVDGGGFENCTSLTRLVFPPSFTSFRWNVINGSGVNYLEMQADGFNEIYFYNYSVSGLQQNGTFVTKASVFDTEFGGEWQGLFDNGWHWESLEPMLKLWDMNWSSATILANDYDIRDANGNQITATDTYNGGNQHWITFSAEPATINKLFDSNTGGRVYYAVICCNELQSIGSDVFQYCGNLGNISSFTVTAPTVQNDTFKGVPLNGTLQYQSVSNYSTWLSTSGYYLGWYGWNGLGSNAIIVKSSSNVGLRNGYLTDVNNNAITASLVENDGNGIYKITLSGTPAHIADCTVSGDDYGWLDGDRTDVSQVIWNNASNLRTIGDNAFNGLTVYFDNNMPNLTVIGDYAFKDANIQGDEFITENITSIGTGAFLDAYNNTGSGEFWITGTFTEIPEDALNFNGGVWLKIHSRNISDIGANAFGNASELMFTALNTATVNGYDQGMFSNKYNGYALAVPANQYTDIESVYPGNNIIYLPTMYYTTYDGQPAYDRWGGQWLDSIYANGSGVAIVREGNVSDNINTVTDFYGDIPGGLFDGTSRLTTFNFTHVTSIGNESFDNSAITNIAIPAGCTSIGYGLARTNTVTSVTVDANNPNYYSLDNCVMRKSDDVCIYCPAISNPPEGVTGFDGWCMSGTGRVVDLVIPSTFDGLVGDCCWYETCSIPNVWFNGDPSQMTGEFDDGTFSYNNTPCWVDSAYYNDCVSRWPDNNWQIIVAQGTDEIRYWTTDKQVAPLSQNATTNANVVSNTYGVGYGTIKFDAPLTSVAGLFKTNLGTAGDYENLVKVELPSTVTTIGDQTFGGCHNLVKVNIPSGVTTIGNSAFAYCYKLTNVTIPSGVTVLSNAVFENCKSISNITIPNGVTEIRYAAFHNCESLLEITIPDSVTTVDTIIFEGCKSLASVTIGTGLTRLSNGMFTDCSSLTSIYIPDTLSYIGDNPNPSNPFMGCTNLVSITVGANNPNYDSRDNCNAIIKKATAPSLITGCSTTVIPSTVNTLATSCFRALTIKQITIPSSINYIDDAAFGNCHYLTEIYMEGTSEPTYYNILLGPFYDVPDNGTLHIPSGSISSYTNTIGYLPNTWTVVDDL